VSSAVAMSTSARDLGIAHVRTSARFWRDEAWGPTPPWRGEPVLTSFCAAPPNSVGGPG